MFVAVGSRRKQTTSTKTQPVESDELEPGDQEEVSRNKKVYRALKQLHIDFKGNKRSPKSAPASTSDVPAGRKALTRSSCGNKTGEASDATEVSTETTSSDPAQSLSEQAGRRQRRSGTVRGSDSVAGAGRSVDTVSGAGRASDSVSGAGRASESVSGAGRASDSVSDPPSQPSSAKTQRKVTRKPEHAETSEATPSQESRLKRSVSRSRLQQADSSDKRGRSVARSSVLSSQDSKKDSPSLTVVRRQSKTRLSKTGSQSAAEPMEVEVQAAPSHVSKAEGTPVASQEDTQNISQTNTEVEGGKDLQTDKEVLRHRSSTRETPQVKGTARSRARRRRLSVASIARRRRARLAQRNKGKDQGSLKGHQQGSNVDPKGVADNAKTLFQSKQDPPVSAASGGKDNPVVKENTRVRQEAKGNFRLPETSETTSERKKMPEPIALAQVKTSARIAASRAKKDLLTKEKAWLQKRSTSLESLAQDRNTTLEQVRTVAHSRSSSPGVTDARPQNRKGSAVSADLERSSSLDNLLCKTGALSDMKLSRPSSREGSRSSVKTEDTAIPHFSQLVGLSTRTFYGSLKRKRAVEVAESLGDIADAVKKKRLLKRLQDSSTHQTPDILYTTRISRGAATGMSPAGSRDSSPGTLSVKGKKPSENVAASRTGNDQIPAAPEAKETVAGQSPRVLKRNSDTVLPARAAASRFLAKMGASKRGRGRPKGSPNKKFRLNLVKHHSPRSQFGRGPGRPRKDSTESANTSSESMSTLDFPSTEKAEKASLANQVPQKSAEAGSQLGQRKVIRTKRRRRPGKRRRSRLLVLRSSGVPSLVLPVSSQAAQSSEQQNKATETKDEGSAGDTSFEKQPSETCAMETKETLSSAPVSASESSQSKGGDETVVDSGQDNSSLCQEDTSHIRAKQPSDKVGLAKKRSQVSRLASGRASAEEKKRFPTVAQRKANRRRRFRKTRWSTGKLPKQSLAALGNLVQVSKQSSDQNLEAPSEEKSAQVVSCVEQPDSGATDISLAVPQTHEQAHSETNDVAKADQTISDQTEIQEQVMISEQSVMEDPSLEVTICSEQEVDDQPQIEAAMITCTDTVSVEQAQSGQDDITSAELATDSQPQIDDCVSDTKLSSCEESQSQQQIIPGSDHMTADHSYSLHKFILETDTAVCDPSSYVTEDDTTACDPPSTATEDVVSSTEQMPYTLPDSNPEATSSSSDACSVAADKQLSISSGETQAGPDKSDMAGLADLPAKEENTVLHESVDPGEPQLVEGESECAVDFKADVTDSLSVADIEAEEARKERERIRRVSIAQRKQNAISRELKRLQTDEGAQKIMSWHEKKKLKALGKFLRSKIKEENRSGKLEAGAPSREPKTRRKSSKLYSINTISDTRLVFKTGRTVKKEEDLPPSVVEVPTHVQQDIEEHVSHPEGNDRIKRGILSASSSLDSEDGPPPNITEVTPFKDNRSDRSRSEELSPPPLIRPEDLFSEEYYVSMPSQPYFGDVKSAQPDTLTSEEIAGDDIPQIQQVTTLVTQAGDPVVSQAETCTEVVDSTIPQAEDSTSCGIDAPQGTEASGQQADFGLFTAAKQVPRRKRGRPGKRKRSKMGPASKTGREPHVKLGPASSKPNRKPAALKADRSYIRSSPYIPSEPRTFALRPKTTRSPIEIIAMRQKLEEEAYELEEATREARKLKRKQAHFGKLAAAAEPVPEQVGGTCRPCSVILVDFVKELHLNSIDTSDQYISDVSYDSDEKDFDEGEDDFVDYDPLLDETDLAEGYGEVAIDKTLDKHFPRIKIQTSVKSTARKTSSVENSLTLGSETGQKLPVDSSQMPSTLEKNVPTLSSSSPEVKKSAPDLDSLRGKGFMGNFVDFIQNRGSQEVTVPPKVRNRGYVRPVSVLSATTCTSVVSTSTVSSLASVSEPLASTASSASNVVTASSVVSLAQPVTPQIHTPAGGQTHSETPQTDVCHHADHTVSSSPVRGGEPGKQPEKVQCSTFSPSFTKAVTEKGPSPGKIKVFPSRKDADSAAGDKAASTRYLCTKCDFSATNKLTIESHIYRHIPGVNFKCGHCESEFTGLMSAATHVKNSHQSKEPKVWISKDINESSLYTEEETQLCSEPVVTSPTAQQQRTGLPDPGGVTSQLCENPMQESQPVIISLVVSGDVAVPRQERYSSSPLATQRRFACTHCSYSTSVMDDAQQHVRDLHSSNSLYTCYLCDKAFGCSLQEVETHCSATHPDRPNSFKKLPDFYDQELLRTSCGASDRAKATDDRGNIFDRMSSLFPGLGPGAEVMEDGQLSPQARFLRARDYLYIQEGWSKKTSAEADSTTTGDIELPLEESAIVDGESGSPGLDSTSGEVTGAQLTHDDSENMATGSAAAAAVVCTKITEKEVCDKSEGSDSAISADRQPGNDSSLQAERTDEAVQVSHQSKETERQSTDMLAEQTLGKAEESLDASAPGAKFFDSGKHSGESSAVELCTTSGNKAGGVQSAEGLSASTSVSVTSDSSQPTVGSISTETGPSTVGEEQTQSVDQGVSQLEDSEKAAEVVEKASQEVQNTPSEDIGSAPHKSAAQHAVDTGIQNETGNVMDTCSKANASAQLPAETAHTSGEAGNSLQPGPSEADNEADDDGETDILVIDLHEDVMADAADDTSHCSTPE